MTEKKSTEESPEEQYEREQQRDRWRRVFDIALPALIATRPQTGIETIACHAGAYATLALEEEDKRFKK